MSHIPDWDRDNLRSLLADLKAKQTACDALSGAKRLKFHQAEIVPRQEFLARRVPSLLFALETIQAERDDAVKTLKELPGLIDETMVKVRKVIVDEVTPFAERYAQEQEGRQRAEARVKELEALLSEKEASVENT